MSKNVLIPRAYLEKIVEMLDYADVSRFPNFYDYIDVIRGLKLKMQKLEIRDTYAKVIQANDPDSMHDARIEYLWRKSQLGNFVPGEIDF